MLKSILNLEGVQGLSKNDQKEINGGMLIISKTPSCEVTCARLPHPPQGTPCGPSHCPGVCDGHGNANRY